MRMGAWDGCLSCRGHPPSTTVAIRWDQLGLGFQHQDLSLPSPLPALSSSWFTGTPLPSPSPLPPPNPPTLVVGRSGYTLAQQTGAQHLTSRRKHKASPVGWRDSGRDESLDPKATSRDGDRTMVPALGVPISISF